MEHTSVSYSRPKRKFPQVEDMPGTQTLVNLVSILSACKQDFLYHDSQKWDLEKSSRFFQQMFGDVRFICMGGTPQVKWTQDFQE